MCFQFRPGHSGMCDCSFNFVFGRSILKHCHSISCFVIRFRQLQFKFVGHSSWARDSKSNFVYWHSFSSKFQSKSSPRCKGPNNTWRIWMTKIMNLFERMTNSILAFVTRFSDSMDLLQMDIHRRVNEFMHLLLSKVSQKHFRHAFPSLIRMIVTAS